MTSTWHGGFIPPSSAGRSNRHPPATMGIAVMQYHDITTGPAAAGTLNTGGLYKRQMTEPILDFVHVDDIDAVLAKVAGLGGTILIPKTAIPGVGTTR